MPAKPSSSLLEADALKQIPLFVFFFSRWDPAKQGRRRSPFFAPVVVDKRELAGRELRVVVVTKPRIFEASVEGFFLNNIIQNKYLLELEFYKYYFLDLEGF